MLKLEGVSYRYAGADRDSLHAVSLEVVPRSITGLIGPAEAGKSTLCLVAGGLAPRVVGGRLTGSLTLDGEDVTRWPMHRLAEHVVTGLQDPAGQLSLLADTVFEEVAFGPTNLGLSRDEIGERSTAALRQVGLETLAYRDPRRLSGGELQLVVLAGLMAMRPRYLVLDEPLAHLDARATSAMLDAISTIAAAGTGVLLVEQRIDALASICDSLAVVASGNVVAHGPTQMVLSDPTIAALGVGLPADRHMRQRIISSGLDPALLERER
ncbi:MAG: energy-coupling factor ABC transporter ATP-binding protein [Chloroflexota bacterium]